MKRQKINYAETLKKYIESRIHNYQFEVEQSGYYKISADVLNSLKESEIVEINDFIQCFKTKNPYNWASGVVKGIRQCGMLNDNHLSENILYECFNHTSMLEDYLHDVVIHPSKRSKYEN